MNAWDEVRVKINGIKELYIYKTALKHWTEIILTLLSRSVKVLEACCTLPTPLLIHLPLLFSHLFTRVALIKSNPTRPDCLINVASAVTSLPLNTRMFFFFLLHAEALTHQSFKGKREGNFCSVLRFQRCKSRVECVWLRSLAFPFFHPLPTIASEWSVLEEWGLRWCQGTRNLWNYLLKSVH